MVALIASIGVIATVFLSLAWGAFMRGWATSVLWGWFVVPVFNVPALTIGTAAGLALVVGYLANSPRTADSDDKKDEPFGKSLLRGLMWATLWPLLVLLIGWGIRQFAQVPG